MIYELPIAGWQFPIIANSTVDTPAKPGLVSVVVDLRAGRAGGALVDLTDIPPMAATQPSALSGFSLPRNLCVTAGPYTHGGRPFPEYCGYLNIFCSDGSVLNASATIGKDGSSLVLSAPSNNCTAVATSYGRADWPMTVFFTKGAKALWNDRYRSFHGTLRLVSTTAGPHREHGRALELVNALHATFGTCHGASGTQVVLSCMFRMLSKPFRGTTV